MLPLMMDVKESCFLIVGSGTIALRKLNTLLDFGVKVTVLSPHWAEPTVKHIESTYHINYLKDFQYVVAATDDVSLNNQICKDCKTLSILCNHIGDVSKSDFYIPGIIKTDNVTIAIATDGKAPGITKVLKERITPLLSDDLEEVIRLIDVLRRTYKERGLNDQIKNLYKMTIQELITEGAKYENQNRD